MTSWRTTRERQKWVALWLASISKGIWLITSVNLLIVKRNWQEIITREDVMIFSRERYRRAINYAISPHHISELDTTNPEHLMNPGQKEAISFRCPRKPAGKTSRLVQKEAATKGEKKETGVVWKVACGQQHPNITMYKTEAGWQHLTFIPFKSC